MATATPITEATDQTIERLLSDAATVQAAAEKILFDIEPDQVPTGDQLNVLRLAGFETRLDIDRERGRIAGVERWQAEAGSREDFAKAEAELASAAAAERKQRPALEAAIAEAQAKLDELDKRRRAAEKIIQAMNRAREMLRSERCLPRFIRQNYDAAMQPVKQQFRRRIKELETTLGIIDKLESIDLATLDGSRSAVLHLQTADPSLIRDHSVNSQAWKGYVARRAAERPAIKKELERLKHECEIASSKPSKLLSYYTDQL